MSERKTARETADMAQSFVDLHCHSTASDGTLSPAEVVRLARRCRLSGLAVTDHDTVGGIAEAEAEARASGIDFIAGIEISCQFPTGTMHLLGYGVDPVNPALTKLTTELVGGRDDRNPKIVEKLNQLGVSVTMDEWRARASGGVLGRPQLAAILVEKGYVRSIQQAFDKYLGSDGLAYFDKERLPAREALDRIRQSGGLPVLAHPRQLRTGNDAELQTAVKNLVDLGLAGIEVIHSDHDADWVCKCEELANRFGLLKTGGSDFHGTNKKDISLGVANGRRVPRAYFDALKEQLAVVHPPIRPART